MTFNPYLDKYLNEYIQLNNIYLEMFRDIEKDISDNLDIPLIQFDIVLMVFRDICNCI